MRRLYVVDKKPKSPVNSRAPVALPGTEVHSKTSGPPTRQRRESISVYAARDAQLQYPRNAVAPVPVVTRKLLPVSNLVASPWTTASDGGSKSLAPSTPPVGQSRTEDSLPMKPHHVGEGHGPHRHPHQAREAKAPLRSSLSVPQAFSAERARGVVAKPTAIHSRNLGPVNRVSSPKGRHIVKRSSVVPPTENVSVQAGLSPVNSPTQPATGPTNPGALHRSHTAEENFGHQTLISPDAPSAFCRSTSADELGGSGPRHIDHLGISSIAALDDNESTADSHLRVAQWLTLRPETGGFNGKFPKEPNSPHQLAASSPVLAENRSQSPVARAAKSFSSSPHVPSMASDALSDQSLLLHDKSGAAATGSRRPKAMQERNVRPAPAVSADRKSAEEPEHSITSGPCISNLQRRNYTTARRYSGFHSQSLHPPTLSSSMFGSGFGRPPHPDLPQPAWYTADGLTIDTGAREQLASAEVGRLFMSPPMPERLKSLQEQLGTPLADPPVTSGASESPPDRRAVQQQPVGITMLKEPESVPVLSVEIVASPSEVAVHPVVDPEAQSASADLSEVSASPEALLRQLLPGPAPVQVQLPRELLHDPAQPSAPTAAPHLLPKSPLSPHLLSATRLRGREHESNDVARNTLTTSGACSRAMPRVITGEAWGVGYRFSAPTSPEERALPSGGTISGAGVVEAEPTQGGPRCDEKNVKALAFMTPGPRPAPARRRERGRSSNTAMPSGGLDIGNSRPTEVQAALAVSTSRNGDYSGAAVSSPFGPMGAVAGVPTGGTGVTEVSIPVLSQCGTHMSTPDHAVATASCGGQRAEVKGMETSRSGGTVSPRTQGVGRSTSVVMSSNGPKNSSSQGTSPACSPSRGSAHDEKRGGKGATRKRPLQQYLYAITEETTISLEGVTSPPGTARSAVVRHVTRTHRAVSTLQPNGMLFSIDTHSSICSNCQRGDDSRKPDTEAHGHVADDTGACQQSPVSNGKADATPREGGLLRSLATPVDQLLPPSAAAPAGDDRDLVYVPQKVSEEQTLIKDYESTELKTEQQLLQPTPPKSAVPLKGAAVSPPHPAAPAKAPLPRLPLDSYAAGRRLRPLNLQSSLIVPAKKDAPRNIDSMSSSAVMANHPRSSRLTAMAARGSGSNIVLPAPVARRGVGECPVDSRPGPAVAPQVEGLSTAATYRQGKRVVLSTQSVRSENNLTPRLKDGSRSLTGWCSINARPEKVSEPNPPQSALRTCGNSQSSAAVTVVTPETAPLTSPSGAGEFPKDSGAEALVASAPLLFTTQRVEGVLRSECQEPMIAMSALQKCHVLRTSEMVSAPVFFATDHVPFKHSVRGPTERNSDSPTQRHPPTVVSNASPAKVEKELVPKNLVTASGSMPDEKRVMASRSTETNEVAPAAVATPGTVGISVRELVKRFSQQVPDIAVTMSELTSAATSVEDSLYEDSVENLGNFAAYYYREEKPDPTLAAIRSLGKENMEKLSNVKVVKSTLFSSRFWKSLHGPLAAESHGKSVMSDGNGSKQVGDSVVAEDSNDPLSHVNGSFQDGADDKEETEAPRMDGPAILGNHMSNTASPFATTVSSTDAPSGAVPAAKINSPMGLEGDRFSGKLFKASA